jgi:hypothetical protein
MHKEVLYVMCWKELKAKVTIGFFIFVGHKVIRG